MLINKIIAFVSLSFCVAYILIGCQKHIHHSHNAHTEHSKHNHSDGKIMVHNPWVRAVPPVSETSAAYMMLMNHGDKDDQLISVKSSIAKVVEIHNVKDENGVMKMFPVKLVEIPAGENLELKPGGLHLMLMKLNKTLKINDEIEFILHFKNSGKLKVIAPVKEGKPMKHNMKHDHG